MDLSSLPIEVTTSRDAGTGQQIAFQIVGDASTALARLLAAMPAGTEISASDPTNLDCALEVRRTQAGYEAKRGCHGAAGTWRPATAVAALDWLLPGTGLIAGRQSGLMLWVPRR